MIGSVCPVTATCRMSLISSCVTTAPQLFGTGRSRATDAGELAEVNDGTFGLAAGLSFAHADTAATAAIATTIPVRTRQR